MHRFDPTMILNTHEKLSDADTIKDCKPSFNAQKWLISNVFKPSRKRKNKCE